MHKVREHFVVRIAVFVYFERKLALAIALILLPLLNVLGPGFAIISF